MLDLVITRSYLAKDKDVIYKVINFIDYVLSLLFLIFLSPFFLVIAISIKIDSKGPVFFKQTRTGEKGEKFSLYKFRTMHEDVDPYGSSPKSSEDPRITKVGRFLRETSLDELPQLINVLKGEMSLVGPRPLLPWQAEEFNEFEARRLEVKPGITGLAQINGRGELTWEEKIEYDVKYVENRNLILDLKIILLTLKKIFGREKVYESEEGGWKDD